MPVNPPGILPRVVLITDRIWSSKSNVYPHTLFTATDLRTGRLQRINRINRINRWSDPNCTDLIRSTASRRPSSTTTCIGQNHREAFKSPRRVLGTPTLQGQIRSNGMVEEFRRLTSSKTTSGRQDWA